MAEAVFDPMWTTYAEPAVPIKKSPGDFKGWKRPRPLQMVYYGSAADKTSE